MNAHREFFAGPTTSGYAGQVAQSGNTAYLHDTTPETPTSTQDWISPSLGSTLNLSVNRAERTAGIFNRFACPSARLFNQRVFDDQGMEVEKVGDAWVSGSLFLDCLGARRRDDLLGLGDIAEGKLFLDLCQEFLIFSVGLGARGGRYQRNDE